MKGKTKLKSVLALLIALVLAIVGINPIARETNAEELTSITWEDFGFTLGTTYAGATDESSAASNAGSYESATNLNNTEFVGDVVFGDNSEIRYGGSAYNYGLKIKVEDGAFKVSGSNLYLYSTTDGSLISEIVIPKTDAGNYGLISFADEQFTLKIQITGWNGNSGWTSMMAGIWINDVAVIESVKLGSETFGNMFCTCVYGSVTPSVKLAKITWEDFGFTLGTTYSLETEDGAGDRSGVYAGSTNLNNTEFKGDIIFGDNSEIRYGGDPFNCGIKIKVEDGSLKVGGANFYLYSTVDGSLISEIVIPETDAGDYGLTSFVDELFTLKIKITGWNGNSGWTSMMAGIWINDVAVIESVKLGSGNFGSNFCACTYGTVTIPEPALAEISWKDFEGAEYGKTYNSQQLLTYKGDSLDNTAFEDDIIFPAGGSLLYAVSNAWHGLELGVNDSGQFWIKGSCYFNGGNSLDATYEAANFGLTTLINTRLTLRIEMRNVADTYADVDVYVNGIQAGSRIALTKSENNAVANIGVKIAACPFNAGDRQPFTIPNEYVLSECYYDLSEGVYTLPEGLVEVLEKTIENETEGWSILAVNDGDSLSAVGDYKVVYSDGRINYMQEVILYTSGTSDLKAYMRTLKHIQGVQNSVYKKADLKMCDVNNNSEIEQEDKNIILQILLGLFS